MKTDSISGNDSNFFYELNALELMIKLETCFILTDVTVCINTLKLFTEYLVFTL